MASQPDLTVKAPLPKVVVLSVVYVMFVIGCAMQWREGSTGTDGSIRGDNHDMDKPVGVPAFK